MNNFEETIIRIDNHISVPKNDVDGLRRDFDVIRNYLIDIMQQTDPVFKKIYDGPSLLGSYCEHMKSVANVDEFDLHFSLKLPFYEHIELTRDCFRPGYIKLLLSKPLLLMRDDTNSRFVYDLFGNFVTPSKYLLRSEIQHWLERIITTALKTYGSSVPNAAGTDEYDLLYLTRGTAHTIKAFSKSREFSIDFVPAFRFNANCDWIAERPFPKDVIEKLWFAVPKSSVGPKRGRKLTFSVCVPQTEKHLLTAKYNLKSSLRLLKSIRDKVEHGYVMKSYFIKSIYLFENDKQDDDFWKQSPGKLLLHMIDQLLICLENKCLPLFWCPSMDLLKSSLSASQVLSLKLKFQDVKDSLELFSNQPKVDYKKIRRLFGTATKPLKIENI